MFGDTLFIHKSKQKNSYDYQFNTIHDYSLIGGLDGLIINYGTLGIQLREDDPNKFVGLNQGPPDYESVALTN